MFEKFLIPPGKICNLEKFDPNYTGKYKNRNEVKSNIKKFTKEMFKLQYKLYADGSKALLIILQAIDAGGKDGTIKHFMGSLNPQGCMVSSFKVPTPEELAHDFLWRIHKNIPPRGSIGIFNRSHYEEV